MTGKTDKLKLTDEQKTRLLNLALEPEASDKIDNTDEAKGDLLCDILRCPLPATDHPPGTTKAIATGFGSALGPSLGQLLNDPKTDVAMLRRIKDYAKVLGDHATGELEKDVFLAVYFAAIAAGLTYHGTRITKHSDHDLEEFFGVFAKAPWMARPLGELFSRAACWVVADVKTHLPRRSEATPTEQ